MTTKEETKLTKEQQEALDKLKELMQGPMDYYNSERLPDEMDLVQRVRDLFIQNGAGHLLNNGFESSRFIIEAKDKSSHAQQFNLNRWLSLQLMAKTGSDPVMRYSLIYEIRPDQWLGIFETRILPNFLALDLPVMLDED